MQGLGARPGRIEHVAGVDDQTDVELASPPEGGVIAVDQVVAAPPAAAPAPPGQVCADVRIGEVEDGRRIGHSRECKEAAVAGH